jgi:hypothetical protein
VPGSTVGRRDPARDPTGLTPVVAARAPAVHHGGRALYDPPVSVEPHIRKVRPDDLEEVWRVHVVSSNDLLVRRGRPPARPPDTPVASDARAGLASDPDGYLCAVAEGRIRGMVSALVRGLVWFLSMFFVLPGDQGSVVNFNALAPPRLRPRPQAITPPAPHTGTPLEPQAQSLP